MRAGFGTYYVPPNRRGGITASATTKEPASSIPVVVQQPLKTKSLLPAKNRQETVVATTQLEPVETVLIAKPLPTREINDPEPASKIPIALPLPPAIITTSSSSTNETVKDVHMAEKKGERKPKVSRGTTGVYVPPSRRAAAAAAAVVNEADTEIPEVITKKRKLSTDGSAHSAVHPTLGDVTMGLTSSRSKSNSDDTTLLPTTKRGRGFHKLLMEQANAEEISERKRMGMLKLIQQSETDQCIEGTTNIEASRPETVFLEEVSASQRMIFHSLGIVVKKTTLS